MPYAVSNSSIAWHGVIAAELCDNPGPKLRQVLLCLPHGEQWGVYLWKPERLYWPGELVRVFDREQDADAYIIERRQ